METATAHDDLVTGDGIVVALPVAGPVIRIASGLIDAAAEVALLVVALIVLAATVDGLDEALTTALVLVVTVAALLGLPVLCESLTGRTLGKKLTGLRTVRSDGTPADPRRVLTRHLVGFVEIWVAGGLPALVALLLTDPTRRIGDLAAGTYVARDRVSLTLPTPPRMPPALAAWAHSADIGHIPDDLAVLIRTTLAQGGAFTHDSTARIHAMLYERLLSHVAPPPPAGASPTDVLTAVLAERRDRDTARLRITDARRAQLFETPSRH